MRLAWRKTYIITACVALYFNSFVLVVQFFEKVSALKALSRNFVLSADPQ